MINKLNNNALRNWWYLPFAVYLVPNVLMSLFVITFGLLVVDGIPVELTANVFTIILVTFLLIGVFYYIKFLCQYYNKKALTYKDKLPSKYVGGIIFLLQLLHLLILLIFDFGRVGGVESSANPIVKFASFLPTDILVLLYYGHQRKNGIPYINLSIYLLINILEGWTGILLILFFIEIYFQLKAKSFKKVAKRVVIASAIIFAFYPAINKYKFLIRGSEDYRQNQTLLESAGILVIRLQHVTNAILIAQEANSLTTALNNKTIIPYYLDNRIGSYLINPNAMNIQKYLSVNYLIDKNLFSPNTDIDELGWYINVGIIGWFFVLSPFEIFFYLTFITLLITVPFILNHYFLKSEGVIPVMQTLTFTYVFHGWFTVHVGYIYGVIFYVFLCKLFIKRKNSINNSVPNVDIESVQLS